MELLKRVIGVSGFLLYKRPDTTLLKRFEDAESYFLRFFTIGFNDNTYTGHILGHHLKGTVLAFLIKDRERGSLYPGISLMARWECIAVPREKAESARRALKSRGLLAPGARLESEGGRVFIPVSDAGRASHYLAMLGISVELCEPRNFGELPRRPQRLRGPIRGYMRVGDIAIFSAARGISIDEYRKAALELVSQGLAGSVWLKTSTRGTERVAELVHLAGEKRTLTRAKEYGLVFWVDVARVYFNPRLQEERRRIALGVGDGERVLDMFAGVGPFSIHIASVSRARVLAVDMNPDAIRLMIQNILINKKYIKGCITPVLSDSMLLPSFIKPIFNKIIMNNPTMTPAFLGVACALARADATIHYYRVSQSCDDAIKEALAASSCRLEPLECVRVLDYSPRTYIFRISFARR